MTETDRILVVEDEILVGLEIKEDLERLGYAVPDIVERGEDVLEAVRRFRPSLVVMDIRIAGEMDGIDAASLIKAEHDLPVLFLTAYSDEKTLGRAAFTGPDAYLLKPFDERELAANVAMILARRKGRGAHRSALAASTALVDALPGPAILADPDGFVAHANQPALRLLAPGGGVTIHGEPVATFLSGPDGPVKTLDGALLSHSVSTEAIKREDGERIGDLILLERMSEFERLNLESSAEAVNRALADLVPASGAAGPEFEVAAFLLPCPSGSGDLVDAFRIDGRFSFVHGLDVMGHGSLSSLVAYSLHDLVRDATRAHAGAEALPGPAGILRAINERYGAIDSGKPFFTMAACVVDSTTGEFAAVRAGHPPVLLLPANGRCTTLQGQGCALGVLEEPELEEHRGRLGPGDSLLIVSDGLLENAFGLDLGPSVECLSVLLDSRKDRSPRELAALLRELAEGRRSATRLHDDASLIVIGRKGR